MPSAEPLPPAAANLIGFARLVRSSGLAIAPEQTAAFLEGVALVGPRSMTDIYDAATATLAPTPESRREFDALFRAWFWGDAAVIAEGDSEEETPVKDADGPEQELPPVDRREESGESASGEEQLGVRRLSSTATGFKRLARELPSALPKRRSFRHVRTTSGGGLDLRRSLRAIVGADGDVPRPILRKRLVVSRRLVVLIDISGSMKAHTEEHLRLAHAVVQAADRVEVFTLGTRLTRVTTALRVRDPGRALERVSGAVEDWDGGTRIGPTLQALLATPRYADFVRGAAVVLLSDGLERGSHAEMEAAIRRIFARAHRLSLLTPLAADPRFQPRTAGLRAILPYLDDLSDGHSPAAVADFILKLARPAPSAATIWRTQP